MSLNVFELQIYLVLKPWELAYFTIAKKVHTIQGYTLI